MLRYNVDTKNWDVYGKVYECKGILSVEFIKIEAEKIFIGAKYFRGGVNI